MVTHTSGDITTEGAYAYGISASSNQGDVMVTHAGGDITTEGDYADGISASSNQGDVMVTHAGGNIATEGADADGISARSTGGDIAITLNGGTISAADDGVEFFGGASNTLTTKGTLSIAGGTTDILGGTGDETVNNYGTLTTPGDIDLGDGANGFYNFAGAVFNSGTSVNLGAGNMFTNRGDLSPGGIGAFQTTMLTGNLVQTGTGAFTVDIGGAPTDRDFVDIVDGGTAELDGTVVVNMIAVPGALTQEYLILSAAGGTTDDGLSLAGKTSPALQAMLLYPNASDLVLGITVDFSTDGLTRIRPPLAII
jgi:hypothetical protein